MVESVVTIRSAGHSYDGRHWQFRDLDLDMKRGDILAILGPNGRGKSTLLRAMAHLLKLNSGMIDVLHTVGFVPQDFAGSFPYSVLDIVLMGRARHVPIFRNPTKTDTAIAMDALVATGMERYAEQSFNALSGGEKQLVLIARALAGENAILLLDEPASALDLKNQDNILGLMRDLASAKHLALAFTTHQPNHALAVADHVLLMLDETRTILGPVDEVMTDQNLEALYGIPVRSLKFQEGNVERIAIVPIFRDRSASAISTEKTVK
ncbi:ABC transporter ATP-binding protein [Candidatus Phyllobacterium onerii]|uniref:ABC transporter ATP-binding protein n=1 Tax=Candidatus Phyllobacterium onerii TaxID=3020828 RepID=UPI00232D6744|nr:ABC transporter ATP-binding protein [Phyllobacterium sp. IY22]